MLQLSQRRFYRLCSFHCHAYCIHAAFQLFCIAPALHEDLSSCSTSACLAMLAISVLAASDRLRFSFCVFQVDHDLLNPPAAYEAKLHKLKRLVQKPNSFFMDVKCPGCFQM